MKRIPMNTVELTLWIACSKSRICLRTFLRRRGGRVASGLSGKYEKGRTHRRQRLGACGRRGRYCLLRHHGQWRGACRKDHFRKSCKIAAGKDGCDQKGGRFTCP